jgi:hypothetical protein
MEKNGKISKNKITFSTCWYMLKAKFNHNIYKSWIDSMLSNVNNYNLVIYCDSVGYEYIEPYLNNPFIKAIIKPLEEFFTYQFRDKWIENHKNNDLLNKKIDWELNMLWSEKINFVFETMSEKYFETEYYGWCDIGYFRNRPNDLSKEELKNWPSNNKIEKLNKKKIHYALVNNNNKYIQILSNIINNKSNKDLPNKEIPPNQISIAGGFFICHEEKIKWWHDYYYDKLNKYFENNYLVKDDQIVIADCIFSNPDEFELCKEEEYQYDNWFLFQRYLL